MLPSFGELFDHKQAPSGHGRKLATFSRTAGEGPRATRVNGLNSLLLILGEAVSPEGAF
jgi:hypothetical protein